MYERFYNLRERPFALSPDPEYLYLSRVHSEALDSIRYGIESRAGFIIVTGEIGAGKTTLLQSILQRLDDRTVIARIVNTMLDPRELLEAIALDFGLTDVSKSKAVLVRDLGMFLVEQRRQGRRPLLVIDEAQNLGPQALEEVRLLSNLETEKSKLLQILLAGQPNLRDTIASSELEQFRQRIAVSYHLKPLAADETAAYINFRLEHASLGEPVRFPNDACTLIHEVSGGVPRVINVVCDAALVFGYAEERRTIDRAMIDDVITELEETSVVRRRAAAAGGAATIVATPTDEAATTPLPPAATPAAIPAPHMAPVATSASAPAAPRFDIGAAVASAATAEPQVREPLTVPHSEVTTAMKPVAAASVFSETRSSGTAQPSMPDTFWQRPATLAPSPSPSTTTIPTSAGSQPTRDVSLAAARDAALQATQLAASREAVVAEREDLARKQRDLTAREQALLERERQIAEQRRIMSEEYRLMRQTQSARSGAAPGTRSSVAVNRTNQLKASANDDRELTVWQRLFRLLNWSPAVRS
jgi:putative secretion ATPase (PEP-CTERM system associated)